MYQGNSIVDFLNTTGQKSDFASRASLAASKGIQGYSGSAQQNTQLLNMLRGASAPAPVPVVQPVAKPQPTQQPTSTPTSSYSQPAQSNAGGPPPNIVDIYKQQGWNDEAAIQGDIKAGGWKSKVPQAGGGGGGLSFNQPTIDLPGLYNSLFENSGISTVEKDISAKTQQYNQAVSNIKDNPYLSEATMTGRLRKLEDKFNADTQALRGDIATRKADIETQINLQTKQFDINSQQAQQALSQFGALLDSGALNNISGEEIANLTRTTGLSSGIISSAITARKQRDLSTEIKSFDDGVEEGFVIYTIDPMGNIVGQTKQVTGKSAKSSVGQYSADPGVSGFIQQYLNKNSDIGSLWEGVY